MTTTQEFCSPATVRARIDQVLDVLESQLRVLADPDADPDYPLVEDAVRFLGVLTPALYYPVIEQLYAELPRHDPELGPVLSDLNRKHVTHRPLASDLTKLLEGVAAGHMVPRKRILKETTAYAELLRDHILPADAQLAAAFESLPASEREAAADRVDIGDDEAANARRWDEWESLFSAIESRQLTHSKRGNSS